ncbi:MAG TPA: hypothetical protein VKT77_08100, partial [Chthonomonadaceae bacterium]|nr:hypothetical protein [Chthonomonadaceae bacterium]
LSGSSAYKPGHYVNARVTVQYGGGAVGMSDTGTLTYLDGVWAELTKDKGERLLIPIGSIRHIKLLDQGRSGDDSGSLLRGSSPLPPAE